MKKSCYWDVYGSGLKIEDVFTNIKLEGLKNREVENKKRFKYNLVREIKKNREDDTDGHKKISSKKWYKVSIKSITWEYNEL